MARRRNCPAPNCIRIADGKYCPEHNREADKARGTKTERGYGKEFQAERRRLARIHKTRPLTCWRCRKHIHIGTTFHLGHDDNDRTIIKGPEHPHCNLSAAGRSSHPTFK